jgi:hypothetical protein
MEQERKNVTEALLLLIILMLLFILADWAVGARIITISDKLLIGLRKIHKTIYLIRAIYVCVLYFYIAVMPPIRTKGDNDMVKAMFILTSALLSCLLVFGPALTYYYNVFIYPLVVGFHLPFAAFAIASMRKGRLKNEKFFDGVNSKESDFYFQFNCEDGMLTVHKPQQNLWIDGGPGSGKSDTFIKSIIWQAASRGYAGFIYDWEGDPTQVGSPILSQVCYAALTEAKNNNPDLNLRFAFINFTDMMRTVRVNVLSEKYFSEATASLFIRNMVTTLMKNLEPAWKEKTDFWANNAINYVYSVAYLCFKQREKGINTLPHVISICLSDSEAVFRWISQDEEISKNMASMLTAWRLNAQQQTAGAVSSAQLPLSLLNNKYIYWVLSPKEKEEFSLDITNKENPYLLCIGNAPTIKEAVSPAISCIVNIIMGQMNQPGKSKSIFCVDEFPTINLFGIDTFIGTARKHYVSTILALQNFNQAVRDYGDKSAEILKASCGTQMFGMTGNVKTAQEVQDLFGENKQVSESFSEQDSGGGSRSESLQREKIINARDVAGQPTGHFIGKVANGTPPYFSSQFACFAGNDCVLPQFAKTVNTGDEKKDQLIMENVILENYKRIENETRAVLKEYTQSSK